MDEFHIGRGTTKLGSYSKDEVREGLRSGRFLLTDMGWCMGMDNWKALSQFPELTTPDVPPPIDPSIPPSPTGLPWENRDSLGFAGAFLGTVRQVLLEPARAFCSMKSEGGLSEPLIFALIGGGIGSAMELIYGFITQRLIPGAMEDLSKQAELPPFLQQAMEKASHITALDLVAQLVLTPVKLVFFLFIGTAILHVCLMVVGGAKKQYDTTFKVMCYGVGATFLLKMAPVCGGLAGLVWLLVALCIGLQTAHQTTSSKAVTAVLLPVFTCCCAMFAIVAMVMAAVAPSIK